jgi:hypothetical protein
MSEKLTPANIVDQIEKYITLTAETAENDYLIGTRQPHDVGWVIYTAQALLELEEALLAGGIWGQVASEVIARCRSMRTASAELRAALHVIDATDPRGLDAVGQLVLAVCVQRAEELTETLIEEGGVKEAARALLRRF